MKKLLLASCLLFPSLGHAQTSPNWTYGYVPPPQEWNRVIGDKLDRVNGVASGLNITGGQASGLALSGGDGSGLLATPTGGVGASLAALLSGTAPITGLTIGAATGLNTAISSTQNLAGSPGNQNFGNNLYIASDALNTGSGFSVGWNFSHLFGGPSAQGGRVALSASLRLTSPTSPLGTNRNYVGLQSSVVDASGDGGTNLTSGNKGAFFGFSSFFRCAGANTLECTGGEINSFQQPGSSTTYKNIWSLVAGGPEDAVQGTNYDTMLALSAQTGSVGFRDGILFGAMNGQFPITTGGTLIRTIQGIYANGIDFTTSSISGAAIKTAGFVLDGVGNVTAQNVYAVTLQQATVVTVAQIPSILGACSLTLRGRRAAVSDAVSPVFLGGLTGGGSGFTPIFCNGVDWIAA